MVYGNANTLLYIIDKRSVIFKSGDASLLFIRNTTSLEKAHTKATEEKYKQLMISTITHDLKTPISAINGSLVVLTNYVNGEGIKYLDSATIATIAFEYYIYDLIVIIITINNRILIISLKALSVLKKGRSYFLSYFRKLKN